MREAPWLTLEAVEAVEPLAEERGVSKVARARGGFLHAYRRAVGDPDQLDRHGPSGQSWRDRRNNFVARHRAQGGPWWEKDDDGNSVPTRRHLALIIWAMTPTPKRLARWLGVR